ncbi:MAG: xylan 1,4-beta-xylosidase [Anaerophaga sp.]|jgi:alpha-N-arabinofuranosidase|nr:xylan 1,4-beta-xylosidase [Anaerophaga sp.]
MRAILNNTIVCLFFLFVVVFTSCEKKHSSQAEAKFLWFVYEENDEIYAQNPLNVETSHVSSDTSAGVSSSENFSIHDDFSEDSLAFYWNFIRTPREKWFELEDDALKLDFRPVSFREMKNPAFIGHRLQHLRFVATTALSFTPEGPDDTAGLLCIRTETSNYYLGLSCNNKQMEAFVEKTIVRGGQPVKKRLAMKKINWKAGHPVYLRAEGNDNTMNFLISEDNETWETLAKGLDASYLNNATTGGYGGTYIGMYASGRVE